VDFIFDDDDAAAVCLVSHQLIGRLQLDVVAISPEPGHQIGPSLDNAGPTGKVVENLVDDVVRNDVEDLHQRHGQEDSAWLTPPAQPVKCATVRHQ